jgi:biotin carboxyl carrier protein
MLNIKVHPASSAGAALQLHQQGESWYINEKLFDGDVVRLREDLYHIIWNHQSFNISIVKSDVRQKSFSFLINGVLYETHAQDEIDLLKEKLGFSSPIKSILNDVKAPMPGLIQSVHIQVGDEVKKGDILVVLVAMKMENAIKATGPGRVNAIHVEAGQSVEKNHVILEFI